MDPDPQVDPGWPPQYLRRIPWIVRDALGLYRGRILGIVALNLAGVLGAWASLGGLYVYVRHLESGQPLSFRGYTLAAGSGLPSIAALAAGFAAWGGASAACLYWTELRISRVALAYRDHCQRRVLALAVDPRYRGWPGLLGRAPREGLIDLTRPRSIQMGLALHMLLRGVLPAATLVLAVGILLATNPVLCAVLLPVVALYLARLHVINRDAGLATKEFEGADRKARALAGQRIRSILEEGGSPEAKRAAIEELARDAEWARSGHFFYQRRLADDRLHFLSSAFAVVATAVIVVFFAATRAPAQSWASLLVFVVALRFAVSSARHVTGIFVHLSRFYPVFGGYCDFVEAAEAMRARRERTGVRRPEGEPLAFRCSGRLGDGAESLIRLARGDALLLLVPWEPAQAELEGAAAVLESHAAEAPVDLVSGATFCTTPGAIAARNGKRVVGAAQCELLFLTRSAAAELLEQGERGFDGLGAYLVLVTNRPGLLLEEGWAPLRARASAMAVVDEGRLLACAPIEQLGSERRALHDLLAQRRADAGPEAQGVDDLDEDEGE